MAAEAIERSGLNRSEFAKFDLLVVGVFLFAPAILTGMGLGEVFIKVADKAGLLPPPLKDRELAQRRLLKKYGKQ